jgi:histidinol-phosphate aminotransferase
MKPTYGMYKVAADINDIEYREAFLTDNFMLDSDAVLGKVDDNTKVIFLCSPNNPTANSLVKDDVVHILNKFNGIVVIDEAYIDFSEQESYLSVLNNYPNLVVIQTFSKAWGMAGVRLGMGFASMEIIRVFNQIKYPYNVNVLTQQKALEMIDAVEEKDRQVKIILDERQKLIVKLNNISLIKQVYQSDANFVLVRVDAAKKIYDRLLQDEIIVRDRSKVALCEGCLRITIGTPEENEALLKALSSIQ